MSTTANIGKRTPIAALPDTATSGYVARMTLEALLTSPHLIDLILLLTAVEAVALPLTTRMPATAVTRMLLPGIFLLLALRSVLAEAAWPWLPAALAAALIAHLFDLRARWKR